MAFISIFLNTVLIVLIILAAIQFITKSRYPMKHAVLLMIGLLIDGMARTLGSTNQYVRGVPVLNFIGLIMYLAGLVVVIYAMFDWTGKMAKTNGDNLKLGRWF